MDEVFLLDGEMEVVFLGRDIYDENRVKVLCEYTGREYWVDRDRLTPHTANRACAPAGEVDGENRAAADV